MAGVVLGASPFDFVAGLQEQVRDKGACSLPGVSIDYNRFMVIMWRAVSLGWVTHSNAEFVAHGLWHGFDCGLDVSLLRGRRRFRNYKSALEARAKVTKATRVRVDKSKITLLDEWSHRPVDHSIGHTQTTQTERHDDRLPLAHSGAMSQHGHDRR